MLVVLVETEKKNGSDTQATRDKHTKKGGGGIIVVSVQSTSTGISF